MAQLTLYHFEGCPHCSRVRQFMAENHIAIPMKDTHQNPAAKEELAQIGGKSQVPCLIIDKQPLYESEDIIAWFKKNWKRTT